MSEMIKIGYEFETVSKENILNGTKGMVALYRHSFMSNNIATREFMCLLSFEEANGLMAFKARLSRQGGIA